MTLIYAHRGANREAAENTRPAFDKALTYSIDGIETDIQLTRDGVCVLWHDDDLARLALPGRRIDDYTLDELQQLDFAVHFPGAVREGVMRLEDFLSRYRARCRLLLEIKRYAGEPQARQRAKVGQVLALAGQADAARLLVSSFDLESLLMAQAEAPGFPLVLNLEPEHDAAFARRALGEHPFLYGVCVHIATLDGQMVRAVRAAGKFLAVYTCNSDAEITCALDAGVDVLISDLPRRALKLRMA